jgi:hypothetical protein
MKIARIGIIASGQLLEAAAQKIRPTAGKVTREDRYNNPAHAGIQCHDFTIRTPPFTRMPRFIHPIVVRFSYKESSKADTGRAGFFQSLALRSTLPVSCYPRFRIALTPSKFRLGLDFQFALIFITNICGAHHRQPTRPCATMET